jgi:lipid-A-disaccharide synthase
MSPTPSLMIVAGEASGDAHAAALAEALKQIRPDIRFFGATGARMRDAGVETVVATDHLSIVGLVEIGSALPKFISAYKQLKQSAIQQRPDAVILVDWPDFNLRLARSLHRRGFKIIYYISPQLWAWRSHRVKTIQRDVDLMLTILPFEAQWYLERGVRQVEFVGHPLAGQVRAKYGKEEFCKQHQLDPDKPIVSLLPGSRRKELERILPPMLEAADVITQQLPETQFVLVVAPSRSIQEAQEVVNKTGCKIENLRVVHHETREALAASDVAAVASGTATLEAALLHTPMVIVYKESRINWHTLGRLITAEHYGLVNLIAGKRLVTELMQDDLNGDQLAGELIRLLEPNRNATMRNQLAAVSHDLGEGGASERAAKAILNFLHHAN